jgi:hypothetical protein
MPLPKRGNTRSKDSHLKPKECCACAVAARDQHLTIPIQGQLTQTDLFAALVGMAAMNQSVHSITGLLEHVPCETSFRYHLKNSIWTIWSRRALLSSPTSCIMSSNPGTRISLRSTTRTILLRNNISRERTVYHPEQTQAINERVILLRHPLRDHQRPADDAGRVPGASRDLKGRVHRPVPRPDRRTWSPYRGTLP